MRAIFATLFLLLPSLGFAESTYMPKEVRLGILKHDIKGSFRRHHENGYDGNIEVLWDRLSHPWFKYIFSPRPHLGASLNSSGGSHQFYAGLTWRYDTPWYVFFEATFGGEVHTGRIGTPCLRKQGLGTRALFRESISVGVQFNEKHSLSVMLDHASNASTGSRNPGLTAFGVRYGLRI